MLRNILIITGLLVALDPYLGFPQSIDKFILTSLGLFIVLLILLTRKGKMHREYQEDVAENPKVLHVERTEIEDSPIMHIERSIIEDTESIARVDGDETIVAKKTVVRRKKRVLPEESDFDERQYNA